MVLLKFLILVAVSEGIVAQTECILGSSIPSGIAKTYFHVFNWRQPEDSFDGHKDYLLHGETIQMSCQNGFVRKDLPGKRYTFECTDGIFNGTFNYDDLLCKSDFHKYTEVYQKSPIELRSRLFTCQGKELALYQVSVNAGGTLRELYKVCYDRSVLRAKFVFQTSGNENTNVTGGRRRDVWGFDYFGSNSREKLTLFKGYTSKVQKVRLTSAFPNKYSPKKKYPYYFNRGHLASYSDFIYPEDKRASCQYINVAPQWKELNGNSWSLVERTTRNLVRTNPQEWEIYTGVYGSIPTQKGPLFLTLLNYGKQTRGYVPVPKLYWKIAYNTILPNVSRVFVGVNNPELKAPQDFDPDYLICKPKRLDNKNYFRGNEFKGFTYECELEEFLERLRRDDIIVRNNMDS
ncbi:hypothetical protein RUM43_007416 [Polyplax serrata]|uniref:DNA/RNA non-specific endonuclease/pyrophosphatase/phosphodiesterase domain-containing protein n=1 Tax=Polyplax serrata TaxID=468196 RepID=A0AAN8PCM0_POLSC